MKKLLFLFPLIATFHQQPVFADPNPRPLFRPNSFVLYSFQAGSTTEIDNLKVIDLDSGVTVYENSFEEPSDASRKLRLLHWPQGGRDTSNYFLNNSTFARVENGKLILETTGFDQNGFGGYDSHTDAEFTGTLPKNFHVEFEAKRLQWAGHFDFHLYRAESSDSGNGTRTLGGTFSSQRPSLNPADILIMSASGHWFNQFGIIPDASNQNENFAHSIPAPEGSLLETHKLGVSLQNDLLTFFIDGNSVGSITVQEWSLQQDSDGDGVKDSREYDDGTDPYNSNSFSELSGGLVAYYPFDGNGDDKSGNENHLNLGNAPLGSGLRGENNGGLHIGASSTVTSSSNIGITGNSPRTVSLWAKMSTIPVWNGGTLLQWGTETYGYFGIQYASRESQTIYFTQNNLVWDAGYSGYGITTSPADITGTWKHIVLVYDGTSADFYLNGVKQSLDAESLALEQINTVDSVLRLGGNGFLDEIRVYNRAATESEVAQLYAYESAGVDSDADGVNDFREVNDGTDPTDHSSFDSLSIGLLAHYTFDDTSDDSSGFARHALAPDTTFEPGLRGFGKSLGLANDNSQANYWNDPNNTDSDGRINSYTFSVWVRPSTLSQAEGTWHYLFSAPNNAAHLRFGNAEGMPNAKVLAMGNEWPGISGPTFMTEPFSGFYENKWHHVVGVQDESSTFIYVNGRLIGSTENGSVIPFDPWNYTIGNLFNTDTYKGYLDEARIYGRPLSSSDVAELYEAEAADLDSDGDGVKDTREALDGTDPYDSNSFSELSQGLVVYYPFNGNTNDESGNQNHLDAEPMFLNDIKGSDSGSWNASAAGPAESFNNIGITGKSPRTISLWTKMGEIPVWNNGTLLQWGTETYGCFGIQYASRVSQTIYFTNNNLVWDAGYAGYGVTTSPSDLTGTWKHIVLVYDGSTADFYLNGVKQTLDAGSLSLEQINTIDSVLRLGGEGVFDEIRVYNRAATENEVAQLYAYESAGVDSDSDGVNDIREGKDGTNPTDASSYNSLSIGLLAHYTFDDTSDDSSGFARHALAPDTTFEPGLRGFGKSLGLANDNSQANYWNDPNNTDSDGRINSYTFSVWVRPSTLSQAEGTWHYLFSAPNNAAYLRFGNAEGMPNAKVLAMGNEWPGISGPTFTTEPFSGFYENQWHHVVGVQDENSTFIYVNGRLIGSTEYGSVIPFDPWNYTIGNLFNTNTYKGYLDQARIYGRSLSSSDVAELYEAEAADLDSDGDGIYNIHETGTGVFLGATNTGSNPYNSDTSGDGISDGEAVSAARNPLTDYSDAINLVQMLSTNTAGRFNLYTADAIMDLNLGSLMIQKNGAMAEIGLQLQSTSNLGVQPFINLGDPISVEVEMPGNKGFIRVQAIGPR